MGLFSFSNNFEVAVNHPKEVVYKQFVSYIRQKNWDIISSKQGEEISFQTSPTLVSFSMDFSVTFTSIDEKSTILSVNFSSEQLDLGRSKGIINDILKNGFGEQANSIVIQNDEQEQHIRLDKAKKQTYFDTSSYKSWSKVVIIASIILVVIVYFLSLSPSDYSYNEYSSYDTDYETEKTITETNNTSIEPWMTGTWKGSITTSDYYGNPFTFYWTLEISQYGSTTQTVETSIGNYDIETYALSYDRNSEQLYYRDGGGNVTIGVDPYSKKLYMPSEFGTMYLYKQ